MYSDPVNHHKEFLALYAGHHGWLLSWLNRKLGDSFLASDLAQDTFVRVLVKSVPQSLESPRAFLSQIAQGLMIDLWRRRDLERAWNEELAKLSAEQQPSPEDSLALQQILTELDELMQSMPLRVRTAFCMSQIEGRTYSEIASALGVSDRMVKKYMAQAMLAILEFKAAM